MPPIHFEGLVFRPLEDRDAAEFVTAVRESVDTVGRWMAWCHEGYTEAEACSWFADCRSGFEAGTAYEFGIFSEESSTLLGGVGLNQICYQHAFCNLGYWVRQSHQGLGIATRSVQAMAAHAFATLALKRVEVVVAAGNEASERTAVRAGGVLEGIARNRLIVHGASVPAAMFSFIPPSA